MAILRFTDKQQAGNFAKLLINLGADYEVKTDVTNRVFTVLELTPNSAVRLLMEQNFRGVTVDGYIPEGMSEVTHRQMEVLANHLKSLPLAEERQEFGRMLLKPREMFTSQEEQRFLELSGVIKAYDMREKDRLERLHEVYKTTICDCCNKPLLNCKCEVGRLTKDILERDSR